MSERIVEKAEKIIRPVVEELGYTFVDLEYRKDFSGYVLELIMDKDGGVNLDDCERVSRALDQPLDEHDITNGAPYNFNVSSYGLDRKFKNDYDFKKHLNTLVDIKFYAPFEGRKELTATLTDFSDKDITIEFEQKNISIERKLIASISAHLDF